MNRLASIAAVVAAAGLAGAAVPAAADNATAPALEVSAQQTDAAYRTRPRTRVRVTPKVYPRQNFSTPYPLPEGINYPGPNAVRECSFRLVQEHRPSGTVIVPRQRCWWARRY